MESESGDTRIPCTNCKTSEDCPGFQKLADLKDAGVVVYRYPTSKESNVNETIDLSETIDNNTDVFILHNTKSKKMTSKEFVSELENIRVICPKCKYIMDHAQKLLKRVPAIEKNNVTSICDHCRVKAKSRSTCPECDAVVKKFIADIGKDNEQEVTKKRLKIWQEVQKIKKHVLVHEKEKIATGQSQLQPTIHNQYPQRSERLRSETLEPITDKPALPPDVSYASDEDDSKFREPKTEKPKSSTKDSIPFRDTSEYYKKALPHQFPLEIKEGQEFEALQKRHPSILKYAQHFSPGLQGQSKDRPILVSDFMHANEEDKKSQEHKMGKTKKATKEAIQFRKAADFSRKSISEESLVDVKKIRDLSEKKRISSVLKSHRDDKLGKTRKKEIEEQFESGSLIRMRSESFITSISGAKQDKTFHYYFPEDIREAFAAKKKSMQKPKGAISSTELIKDTQDRLRSVEETKQKEEEVKKKKLEEQEKQRQEEKEKKKLKREEKKRLLEEEMKRLEEDTLKKSGKETPISYKTRDGSLTSLEKSKKLKAKAEKAARGEKVSSDEDSDLEKSKRKRDKKKAGDEHERERKHSRERKEHRDKEGREHRDKEGKEHRDKEGREHRDKEGREHRDKEGREHRDQEEKEHRDKEGKEFSEKEGKQHQDKEEKPLQEKEGKEYRDKDENVSLEKGEKDREGKITHEKGGKESRDDLRDKEGKPPKEKLEKEQKSRGLDEKGKTEKGLSKKEKGEDQASKKPEKERVKPDKVQLTGKQKDNPGKKGKKGSLSPEEKEKEEMKLKQKEEAVEVVTKVLTRQEKQEKEESKMKKAHEENLKKAMDAADRAASGKKDTSPKGTRKGSPDKSTKFEKSKPDADVDHKKTLPQKEKGNAKWEKSKELNIKEIMVRNPSHNDMALQFVKTKPGELKKKQGPSGPPISDIDFALIGERHRHHLERVSDCGLCADSDLALDFDTLARKKNRTDETDDIIVGEKIVRNKYNILPETIKEKVEPILFKSTFMGFPEIVQTVEIPVVEEPVPPPAPKGKGKVVEQELPKGIVRYTLSDRTFIDKGWTMLPTEKVVRKMNVYRMRPAHPEFDWFEHNKNKRLMFYDTGERLAEFDDDGRGRWYYRNGRIALDYYDAEEINAQQRFVLYSSGEQDERGRSYPITVLGTFDYLGNGVVFDHSGKIRLKYNQTEGIVLDRTLGPVSHWKWHSLNDPPVLQQVMIDTQMSHKDPEILRLGIAEDDKTRPDNEEMLAIEFDNFIKEKSKKLTQKFKPFQIKMKALKINDQLSLRIIDQATIYLIYRDGTTNMKLNMGMLLDHQEIVDTDTAEMGEVSNNLERLPAKTDSIAGLQRSVAYAQHVERLRTERDRRLRPGEPCASADLLTAATSRSLRRPLLIVPPSSTRTAVGDSPCKCRKPSYSNLYYDTRLI